MAAGGAAWAQNTAAPASWMPGLLTPKDAIRIVGLMASIGCFK